MKTILRILCVLIMFAAVFSLGALSGYCYRDTRIPHLRHFQKRIGAKPDCKVGPETQAKWAKAYMKQTGKYMY